MGKTTYDVPAVEKAVRLIELLCASEDPLGVSEISRHLGTNTNMTFRLLHTLGRLNWVVKENGAKYRISLQPFHCTSLPVSRLNLYAAAQEPLARLWRKLGESTYLCVLDVDKALCLIHLDGRGSVRITARVGGRYDLHTAAPGKVLLAHAGEALLESLARRGLSRRSRHTLRTLDALRKDIDAVRRRGYGLDIEESADGLLCFAAPVRDHAGAVVGAVGISVLSLYYSPAQLIKNLGPDVLATGRAISAALGYRG
jgi:IclR family KDG regulon transcriptional repressor